MRPSKARNFLDIAKEVAKRSPCSRRKYGAVIVSGEGVILSTGYNGSVRGAYNCGEDLECLKDLHKEPHYTSYNYCPAVHAEQNAIINASREGIRISGSDLYLNSSEGGGCQRPCILCRRMIINSGIRRCYYIDDEGAIIEEEVCTWVELENKWMKEMPSSSRKPVQ